MGSNLKDDIVHIQEWMKKDPQLPEPFDDGITRMFLHCTYYSLEQTKKCIERFCSDRHNMPQIYMDRDPVDRNIELAHNLHDSACYSCGDFDIFFFRLGEDLDNFVLQDACKALSLKVDAFIKDVHRIAENHAVVLDLKTVSIKHLPKLNIVMLKDYITYLLEGMPVRIKKIFVINAPPITDMFYNLIKPVLSQNVIEIIDICADDTNLKKCVDMKTFPTDYGGEALNLRDSSYDMWDEVLKNRKMFLNNNLWKGDASKIPKKQDVNIMNGSFRTLAID
ncbi:uncharacterized protein LOC121734202 [Aricia agestis]|uniref:uncharacterized protein LOC121734202 n=1 Tax=Aricia agestis TaxID=91739 RepID=UPI001C203BE6|nr:uncharacterized protein LOC121734202 [Aricia agestis]